MRNPAARRTGALAALLILLIILAAPAARAASDDGIADAALELRDAMLRREAGVTLRVRSAELSTKELTNRLMELACSEENAAGVTAGDYLTFVLHEPDAPEFEFRFLTSDRVNYEVRVSGMTYKTSAEQEAAFQKRLARVMDELDLWGKSGETKVRGIYEYVTAHVRYDDGNERRGLPQSAYAALVEERAVCQGVASLIYAMCRYAGVPVRIVDGIALNARGWVDHAWNIVELDGAWYCLDATWDLGLAPEKWACFLAGTDDFVNHRADAAYTAAGFAGAHPLSAASWAGGADDGGALPFDDLAPDDYYTHAAVQLSDMGLVSGVAPGVFAPARPMTRAMLLTVLYQMAGCPAVTSAAAFPDVEPDAWYARPVVWAVENGMAAGSGDGAFHPDDNLTREQMAVFLHRRAGSPDAARKSLARYDDAAQVSDYALDAVRWAVAEGLLSGTSERTLSPRDPVSRGQAAVILCRLIRLESAD